jgi:hypothetical protein
MSDTAPAPAFQTLAELNARHHVGATQTKPEWSFQAWLHRFLEKAVLPPYEIRGFDKAGAAYARIQTRMAAQGRGIKDGTPDHFVVQGSPLRMVLIECKAGSGEASDAQKATATAYERCGATVARECRTIREALVALRVGGIRLHANADNLAAEYQERVDAALRALMAKKPRKPARGGSKAQKPRVSLSAVRRSNAFTAARLEMKR